ncbi:MAG: prepilin-type N-terminal cleavage/methylation domain-containing protein [Betaproteobacteria bacterium]|nr:MAG: prepilin-type N-terminal cleavage/methylation domain-containing protein [Betaproteobacteria bacterium]
MTHAPTIRRVLLYRSRGFTLVELMVGLTVGLIVIAVVTTIFVNVSNNRRDMQRTGRQIENGRFAVQLLEDDIVNAGYFGEFDPRSVGPPAAKPDPCSTTVADMKNMLMMHIQGYAAAAAKPSCMSDVRSNTAAVAVRRVATCIVGDANCDTATIGQIYFQSTLCNAELSSVPISTQYVVAAQPSSAFSLHKHDCATPGSLRAYVMHIYFVANNNDPGDGIPTLKRAEIGTDGEFSIVPLVEGVEDLQLEYGLDTNGDSMPDATSADPGTYGGCAADPCYIANWLNVMTVKIYLLSRSTEATPGYTDTKTYPLGPRTDGPFNDGFKRHAYTETIRLNNPAGRRE